MQRFYFTVILGLVAFVMLGLFAPGIGELLLGLLVVGFTFVAALVFYVLREDPSGAKQSGAFE